MNETVKNLVTRNSCRKYKNEHITRQELEEILAAGLNAPSGRNRQTVRFVAVQNDATVDLLSRLNAAVMGTNADPFYGARDVVIVLAKKEGTYLYDGSLAMGNLLNAAWSMGIDSCWIHRAKEVFESDRGRELLASWGLTENLEGIGFCILGHAQESKPKVSINPDRVYFV